jgi:hypothetical protein
MMLRKFLFALALSAFAIAPASAMPMKPKSAVATCQAGRPMSLLLDFYK